ARAHPQARLIDAEQALITPAFHDASSAAQPANALHRAGITAAHIHLGSAPDTSGYGPHLDLVGIHTDLPSAGPALHRLAPGATATEMEHFLRIDRAALVEPALTVAGGEDAAAFAELAAGGLRPTARLYLHANRTWRRSYWPPGASSSSSTGRSISGSPIWPGRGFRSRSRVRARLGRRSLERSWKAPRRSPRGPRSTPTPAARGASRPGSSNRVACCGSG